MNAESILTSRCISERMARAVFPIFVPVILVMLAMLVQGQTELQLVLASTAGLIVLLCFPVVALALAVAFLPLMPRISLLQGANLQTEIGMDLLVVGLFISILIAKMAQRDSTVFLPFNKSILLFLGLAGISTLTAISFGDLRPMVGILFLLRQVEFFVLFWLVSNLVKTEKQAFLLIGSVLVSLLVASGQAFYNLFVHHQIVYVGTFQNHQKSGLFLALVMSLAVAIAFSSNKRWIRVLCGVLLLIAVAPLLSALARAAYLGFLAALVAVLLLKKRYVHLMLTLGLLAAAIPFLPLVIRTRIYAIPSFYSGAGDVYARISTEDRLKTWGGIVNTLEDPASWLGHGMGSAWLYTDNYYFRLLVEVGFPGLICFLVLMVAMAKWSLRASRSDFPAGRIAATGFLGMLAVMMVGSMFGDVFAVMKNAAPFWVVAGTAFAVSRPVPGNRPSD